MSQPARLTALILVPVLLLAAIATFGLVEYRHAITADARAQASDWASPERVEAILRQLEEAADNSRPVRTFPEIPAPGSAPDPDAQQLVTATAEQDEDSLRELQTSQQQTTSGIPVAVLSAWRLVNMGTSERDADRLVALAIHEQPSSISAPILLALGEPFPDRSAAWNEEWQRSLEKRSILADHPRAEGLVDTATGAAFVTKDRVLSPAELSQQLTSYHRGLKPPPWMAVDVVAFGESAGQASSDVFASTGSSLKLTAGVGDRRALFASYWKLVGWVAALILCALGTAIMGIVLVQRTIARERRVSELKSQFVASVSHELRTPVASMRLMADALDAGKVKGKAAKNFHRLMSQEGARLSSLIENVLDFSQIEKDCKDYRFDKADLNEIVEDTRHLMEAVATERDVSIVCKNPAMRPVTLDRAAIEQALINLIDNAIKFSPPGGEVEVELTGDAECWQLSVADHGPGIPKRECARVFERFTRLGNELRRETQGTGIGLSIVKHIVEAHGATIRIEANQPTGSKFVIRSAGEPASKPVRTTLATDLNPEPCDS